MNPDFSWVCQTCGAPNHSVLSLGNNLATFESHNNFSSLSDSASWPSELSAEHTTVSHENLRYATLKVLNINARSIKAQDKLDQFHAMLDQWFIDIVIYTKSWLSSDVYDAETMKQTVNYCGLSYSLQGPSPSTLLPIINQVSRTQRVSKSYWSIAMVSTVKGHTWVVGDFNFPKFFWADNIPSISLTVSTHTSMRSSSTS